MFHAAVTGDSEVGIRLLPCTARCHALGFIQTGVLPTRFSPPPRDVSEGKGSDPMIESIHKSREGIRRPFPYRFFSSFVESFVPSSLLDMKISGRFYRRPLRLSCCFMTLFINNSESFAGFFVRLACTAVCQCVETASIIFLSRHVVEPVMGCHDGARIYHMLRVASRWEHERPGFSNGRYLGELDLGS